MATEEYSFDKFPSFSLLRDELVSAVRATPPEQVADWGKRIGRRFVSVGVKRVTNLGALLSRLSSRTTAM